jgi:hypothetical protein
MYHHFYNPYDPYTQAYTMYTSTTTVPTYTLQQTLTSLSNQQSLIYSQREQLAAEEESLRQLRAATLRRMRAQRLHEILEEPDIEEYVDHDFEKTDDDQVINDTVMYYRPCRCCAERLSREILNARRMTAGLPTSSREFQREIRVREMLDPSPRPSTVQFHVPTQPQYSVRRASYPQFHVPPSAQHIADTPIIDELPSHFTNPFSPHTHYFPEIPLFRNKRGSRRNSVRRDSHITRDFIPESTPSVILPQTLESFDQIRVKLHTELSTIPPTIRLDVPPTAEERKTLSHHMARLEDILDDVDAVLLPTESEEDLITARKARRDLVGAVVGAIDGIEKYIQPGTPADGSVAGAGSVHEDSDGEENALIDQDIQRAMRETLGRKKDEDVSRRSVTVEDIPDSEY